MGKFFFDEMFCKKWGLTILIAIIKIFYIYIVTLSNFWIGINQDLD